MLHYSRSEFLVFLRCMGAPAVVSKLRMTGELSSLSGNAPIDSPDSSVDTVHMSKLSERSDDSEACLTFPCWR